MEAIAFGKIPVEPDFVRLGYGGETFAGLDQWMRRGVERHIRTRGRLDVRDRSLQTSFCWPCRRSGDILIGHMASSRDAVGRAYPLVIGLLVSGPSVLALLGRAELPSAVARTETLVRRAAEGRLDRRGLAEQMRELPHAFETLSEPQSVGPLGMPWSDGRAGDVLPEAERLARFAGAMRYVVSEPQTAFGIRFPLGGDDEREWTWLHFWVELHGGLAGVLADGPTVWRMPRQADTGAHGVLFSGHPPSAFFSYLLNPGDDDTVYDVDRGAPLLANHRDALEDLQLQLARPDASIDSLIRTLSQLI